MQRFFISPDLDLSPGAQVQLPAELVHQVGRVLRGRVGDHLILLDGSGMESEVELTHFAANAISARVIERQANLAEPSRRVTLYQCLLKGEKMELVLQKATELGVGAFVPVQSERVVAQPGESNEKRRQRWERIVREAAEQSGRGRLPTIAIPLPWRAALAAARDSLLLVPWEQADTATTLAQAIALAAPDQPIALFIGPEGGLSSAEAEQATAAGAHLVSLGPLILRAETAAIAAATLVLLR